MVVIISVSSLVLCDHVLKLAVIERRVKPAAGEQLRVRALLDDAAAAHDQHAVGIADGAQAVRKSYPNYFDALKNLGLEAEYEA